MNFGIVHETRLNEKRVFLTPGAAKSLLRKGHSVYIESEAGDACGFTDQQYAAAGVQVVFDREELFGRADTLLKILPVSEEDLDLMHEGQTVFAFQHLAVGSRAVFKGLLEKEIHTVGMEIMEDEAGFRPVLTLMSELAGQMAPIIAGSYLGLNPMSRGLSLGGVPGVAPASAVIIGAGTVGVSAARAFLGSGAQVHVLDNDIHKLRILRQRFGDRVITLFADRSNLEKSLRFADVLVSAILVHGGLTPRLLTREMIASMKPRSVLIDYSIDEGGSCETTRPTTHADPVYIDEGVIHYCVPNITSGVSRTASIALSNVMSPYLLALGQEGIMDAVDHHTELQTGLYTLGGKSCKPVLNERFGMPV